MDNNNNNLSIFENECKYWLSYFGLIDWSVVYFADDLGENWAEYKCNLVGRIATLSISNSEMTERQVRKSAFHEVCHLLIADIAHYANEALKGYQGESCSDSEEIQHVIIRRLENSVFESRHKKTLKPNLIDKYHIHMGDVGKSKRQITREYKASKKGK